MKIEHEAIREATKEWLLAGGFVRILPSERIGKSYTAFPQMVGPEAPGLTFPALAFGYAPLITLSSSHQGDDSDLQDI